MPKEQPLRSPVPLSKWVKRVELSEIVRQPSVQAGNRRRSELSFLAQFLEDARRLRLYELRLSEFTVTLVNSYRSNLTRPIVYVPEQPSVEELEMCQVVSSSKPLRPELNLSLQRKPSFG
jgi:hypothetical protein